MAMNRRELLANGGRVGAAAAGLSVLGGLAASSAGASIKGDNKPVRIDGVSLPDYPFYPNLDRTMDPAPDLLDQLARAYGRRVAGPTMDDFLLGWAPSRLFEEVLARNSQRYEIADTLWVLHLTGYFGGIWLRLKFAEFGNTRTGGPPSEAAFDGLAGRLDAAMAAYTGTDADALAYVEDSLRGDFFVAGGLANSYGYNVGYLDQILNGSRPSGTTAPPNFFAFTEDGLFDATYSQGELRGMDRWRRRSTATGRWADEVNAIVEGAGGDDDLRVVQASGVATGRGTWTLPFLSIEGWDQPSYDSLLSTSASFLQAVQTTGMAALAAAARGRADWARRASWANALNGPFSGSYSVGLGDDTYDGMDALDALPQFIWR